MARQQAQVLIEGIQQSHDRRAALVSRYRSIITTFKETKDVGTFKSRKKSYDDEYKRYSDEVAGKLKELQTGDPESAWEAVNCGCGQDVGVALISTANVGYGMGEVDRKWSIKFGLRGSEMEWFHNAGF